jgi:hypothetical protein
VTRGCLARSSRRYPVALVFGLPRKG